MFLETICIQNGTTQNIEAHMERMCKTAVHYGFSVPHLPDIELLLPSQLKEKKVRCRIVYHEKIEEISFEEYIPKHIRSLKLVEGSPEYGFKFSDRTPLLHLLAQKKGCDEILIVQNGCITDTSYSNVVFKKGSELFTPDSYLLNGTKRQKLIKTGVVKETRITAQNIHTFEQVYLINAMLDMEDQRGISIDEVY